MTQSLPSSWHLHPPPDPLPRSDEEIFPHEIPPLSIRDLDTRPNPFSLAKLPKQEQHVIQTLRTSYPLLFDGIALFNLNEWYRRGPIKPNFLSYKPYRQKNGSFRRFSEVHNFPRKVHMILPLLKDYGDAIYSLALHPSTTSLPHFELPPNFSDLTHLSRLELIRLPMVQLSHLPPNLHEIRLKHLPISSLAGLPPSLKILYLEDCPITSFEGLPQSIQRIEIKNHQFPNFLGCPPELPHLEEIKIINGPLSSFGGLPSVLPKCLRIYSVDNPITNLNHLPLLPAFRESARLALPGGYSSPKMKGHITLSNGLIKNFAGFNFPHYAEWEDQYIPISVSFKGTSLISLHGLPQVFKIVHIYAQFLFKTSQAHPDRFPAEYRDIITTHHAAPMTLYSFFSPSPAELASRYIHGDFLSEFELARILYEGDEETLKFLLHHLGSGDSLLKNLSQQLQFPLKLGKYLV